MSAPADGAATALMQGLALPQPEWTLDRAFRRRLAESPDRPFLSIAGAAYETFAETWTAACRLARGLVAAGIGRGDRVVLIARNGREAVHLWLAVNLAGATDAPVNPALRGRPIEHALTLLDAAILIVEDRLLPAVAECAGSLPALRDIYVFTPEGEEPAPLPECGGIALHHLSELDQDACGWSPPGAAFNDVSSILFTSGTSGPSKGVMIPQAQAYLLAHQAVQGMRVTAEDVFYCAHPLFHMSPRYCVLYAALLTGARVWLDRGFQADSWLDSIRRAGATVTIGHGPLLEMIYAEPERPDDADNPLKRLGTSPFPRHIAAAFERRFGIKGIETWGMTEVNIPLWHPYDEPLRPGACGKAQGDFYEVRIVDPETDIEAAAGEVGELVVRSRLPSTMLAGYFRNPTATLEAFRNLWFHTGDAAYVDKDGWYYFVDRLKDRIRRRAENISSFDIEVAAASFPGVAECAAVGVPSEYLADDDIKLCLAPLPGHRVEPDALLAHLAKALPHYMVPRYIEVVDALPRTPTKKVQKSALRASGVSEPVWDRKSAGIDLRRLIAAADRNEP